jgi:membrane-bound lytic murein transglycosylase A
LSGRAASASFRTLVAAGLTAGLAACTTAPAPPASAPVASQRLSLVPAAFAQLSGWEQDRAADAIPAFLKSCAVFLARGDSAPFGAQTRSAEFGRVRDWRAPCAAAAALRSGDDAAARDFFETMFVPLLAGNNGDGEGLFTGYYEPVLRGSRRRGGQFQTPLYRRPPDPTGYARAEIEQGALAGQGLELVWVDDPIDAFFLDIQGSGRIELADGSEMRVGYDGANGRPYVPVGRLLIESGEIPREKMSMAAIRDWMIAHPEAGVVLRRENQSYVFFRALPDAAPDSGPIGSEGTALTPHRSLAVDRRFVPLGIPIWFDAAQRYTQGQIRGLVVAQDVGGAVKGPVRGDLFWGSGDQAAAAAGSMNARGRYYLLVPRAVAGETARSTDAH